MTLWTISLKMRGFVLGIFVSGQAEKQWDQYVPYYVHMYIVIGLLYSVLQGTLPTDYMPCSEVLPYGGQIDQSVLCPHKSFSTCGTI